MIPTTLRKANASFSAILTFTPISHLQTKSKTLSLRTILNSVLPTVLRSQAILLIGSFSVNMMTLSRLPLYPMIWPLTTTLFFLTWTSPSLLALLPALSAETFVELTVLLSDQTLPVLCQTTQTSTLLPTTLSYRPSWTPTLLLLLERYEPTDQHPGLHPKSPAPRQDVDVLNVPAGNRDLLFTGKSTKQRNT